MAVRLTKNDRKLLDALVKAKSRAGVAKALNITESSLAVRLWRIRRKIKQAAILKTEIDALVAKNPKIREYVDVK